MSATHVSNTIKFLLFFQEHFLTELNSLVEFVNDNNIEVALLITRNLIEDSSEKFYDELTKKCQLSFFIIDLNSKNDEDDKVLGYAEVLEVFKNNTWSTVKISSRNHKSKCCVFFVCIPVSKSQMYVPVL